MMISLYEMLPEVFENLSQEIIPEETMEFPTKHSKRGMRRKAYFKKKKKKKEVAPFKEGKLLEKCMHLSEFDPNKHSDDVREFAAKAQMKEFYSF